MSNTKTQGSQGSPVSKATGVKGNAPPTPATIVPVKPPVRTRLPPTGPSGAAKPAGQQSQTASGPDLAPRAETRPRASAAATVPGEREQPEEDYEVGYYRPPKHTRYKPGQSGNPKGRPRGRKNTATILAKSLNARIRVKTARGSKVVTRHEAFIEQLVLDALREPRAREHLLRVILTMEGQAEARNGTGEAPSDQQGVDDETYLAEFRRMVLRAGNPEPSPDAESGRPAIGCGKSSGNGRTSR